MSFGGSSERRTGVARVLGATVDGGGLAGSTTL